MILCNTRHCEGRRRQLLGLGDQKVKVLVGVEFRTVTDFPWSIVKERSDSPVRDLYGCSPGHVVEEGKQMGSDPRWAECFVHGSGAVQ